MSEPLSERRMAENQVVFRTRNEKVQLGFKKLNAIAEEEGHPHMQLDEDTPLHFYCECSDENCRGRIPITPKDYNKIHSARNNFIIIPSHDVATIEDVTGKESKYWVVTKHEQPPRKADVLNKTDVNNA